MNNNLNPKGFKKYFPNRNENKKNDVYDFFISADESVIYKKNKNRPSEIKELLESDAAKNDFKGILSGEGITPGLRPHIVNGFDYEEDGSYKSEFIHGFRLDLIANYELTEKLFSDIVIQCQNLLGSLEIAAAEEELFGDWALHNLVYSLKYERIINVDLEGFMTYKPLPKWANFEVILDWVASIEASKSIQ